MTPQPSGAQPVRTTVSATEPREIGGYRVHARLGSGGMGVVYLAYTRGGRAVALKAVREHLASDPEFRRRFADEVASARRIHGLFTAQVVDSGVDDPVPWLATAYVPGPSLEEVVRRHGPLPLRTVLLLMAGIAEALQAIHGAGVVHRDLKPSNVLIAEDGPRVIDFGIARAADTSCLTGTGLRMGTAAYMAPEQALGLPVTPATDVFALGALTAYMAGGALPFGHGPDSAALYRVVHEPPDLSRVPPELHDLLRGCLAKDGTDRPTPDEIIVAVHAHPAVGPSPEFTTGWLPAALLGEMGEHGVRQADFHAHPTLAAADGPPPRTKAAAEFVPGPGEHRRDTEGAVVAAAPDRRRRRLLLAAAVTMLVAAGAAVHHLVPLKGAAADSSDIGHGARASSHPQASGSAVPVPDRYAPGYEDAELTSPDSGYEFDLQAGKVVPAETATWYLARDGDEFVVPEDSDAFIASGYVLSPQDCVRGIETEPVTSLTFDDLADERPFCVRGPDGRRIVVARLVESEPGEGSATVVLSRYDRRT
ncbi:serine/threonine-protein kinase [Streptomyces sp. Tue6028]|uniref:serine/threonine-protein kinase n=1 Tax=Streptomyces sp. Tue6028 TaxID=2036037 RepID=UPI003EB925FD